MKVHHFLHGLLSFFIVACSSKQNAPSKEVINELNLKRGEIISCGVQSNQFGAVDFNMSCDDKTKQQFNLAAALLHSFEYDEAEKSFAKIIDEAPDCAMAYWGCRHV